MKNIDLHYKMLLEGLKLLAADYDVQKSTLPDFVHIPDEVALIYDNNIVYLQELILDKLINKEQETQLLYLKNILDKMSDSPEIWTLEDLEHNAQWKSLRVEAKKVLSLFSNNSEQPDLFWIKYVQ